MKAQKNLGQLGKPSKVIKDLMDLWFIPYSPHLLACSKLVGSAKLRKRDHENKTGGSWGEEGWLSLPFSRHCPLFPDHAKSRAHIFACVLFTRHPYYLRAWSFFFWGGGRGLTQILLPPLLSHWLSCFFKLCYENTSAVTWIDSSTFRLLRIGRKIFNQSKS